MLVAFHFSVILNSLFVCSWEVPDLRGCARHQNQPHVAVDILAWSKVLSMVLMQRSRCRRPGHFVVWGDWLDPELLADDSLVVVTKRCNTKFPCLCLQRATSHAAVCHYLKCKSSCRETWTFLQAGLGKVQAKCTYGRRSENNRTEVPVPLLFPSTLAAAALPNTLCCFLNDRWRSTFISASGRTLHVPHTTLQHRVRRKEHKARRAGQSTQNHVSKLPCSKKVPRVFFPLFDRIFGYIFPKADPVVHTKRC